MEHHGFVLIADITGYSTYLNESELEHAQQTLTELLELLLDQSRPPFVFSQLEGDAVMSYTLGKGSLGSQTFVERIEETYVEFRRAIDLMVLNNTCQCNACANVSTLDLKFFVHHGSFVIQPVGDVTQLVGSDINLVHRLLKNSVMSDTGIRAYLLATESALNVLGLDPNEEGMVPHQEEPTDFDATSVWVKDMHPVYETAQQSEKAFYELDQILLSLHTEIPIPIEYAWHYANQSEYRNLIIGSDSYEVLDRSGERVARGSTYQCYHGKMTVNQLVLEWKPFERVVLQQLIPMPGKSPTHTIIEFRFEEVQEGVRFTQTATKPTGPPLSRFLAKTMMSTRRNRVQHDMNEFRDRVTEDYLSSRPDEDSLQVDHSQIQAAAADSLQEIAARENG